MFSNLLPDGVNIIQLIIFAIALPMVFSLAISISTLIKTRKK